MSINKNDRKRNQKFNPLPIIAIAVAVIAVAVIFLDIPGSGSNNKIADVNTTKDNSTEDNSTEGSATSSESAYVPATLNEEGDVVIPVSQVTEKATFYEYDSNGTKMALFAVKASDGTIRTALDTCQVCNGSPNAFFKQEGDNVQCQNCGNIYSLDMIEQERGGCNPVPIMSEEKVVSDTEIIIPATFFDENAARFENWKKF